MTGSHPGGLLMVNADDWGAAAETTDAIAACHRVGGITAASAMVFMADSERAAEIARASGLPVGLHLNLTQPFDGGAVPAAVRARQQAVLGHFARLRLRRWVPDPRIRTLVRAAVADQLDEYERRYGARPTRVDGHLHVHLCADVLLSGMLPAGAWVRPTRTRALAASPPPVRQLQRLRERWLRGRFRVVDRFYAIEELAPELGGDGLDAALAAAADVAVEVMTHPSRPHERRLLCSDAWRSRLAGRPVGTVGADTVTR